MSTLVVIGIGIWLIFAAALKICVTVNEILDVLERIASDMEFRSSTSSRECPLIALEPVRRDFRRRFDSKVMVFVSSSGSCLLQIAM